MILHVFKLFFAPAFEGDEHWETVHIQAKTLEIASKYAKNRWGLNRSGIEFVSTVYEIYKNNPDAPIFYSA